MKKLMGWLVAVTLTGLLTGQAPADTTQYRREMALWALRIQNALKTPVTCRFDNATLPEVIQFFRTTLQVNFVLDVPGAEEMLVSLEVRDLEAEKVLSWMTRQAKLEWTLKDEAVLIAPRQVTRHAEAETAYLTQYDVSDLLVSPAQYNAAGGNQGAAGVAPGVNPNQDLIGFLVLFTGRENWDFVQTMGTTPAATVGDVTTTRENRF